MKINENKLKSRLHKYNAYDAEYRGVSLQYDFQSPELDKIYELNKLYKFGDPTQLSTLCNIMHYVFDLLNQDREPQQRPLLRQNFSSLTIYDEVKSCKNRFSCWSHALYLTECLLALGVPARMIRCRSGLVFDRDCHCVTVAYCSEYKKYVMLDSANDVVLYSYSGIPLNLSEFRQYVSLEKRIFYIQKSHGQKASYLKYWIKNLLIFQSYEIQRYGNELNTLYNTTNRNIFLLPLNLDIKKVHLYANKNYPTLITRNEKEF